MISIELTDGSGRDSYQIELSPEVSTMVVEVAEATGKTPATILQLTQPSRLVPAVSYSIKEGFLAAGAGVVSPTPKLFKLRAECRPDVDALLCLISPDEVVDVELVQLYPYPDMVCTLTLRTFLLDELRDACRRVEDGHVMLQTVQPAELYTGERDYNLT